MKTQWILPASLLILVFASLASCSPGAPLVEGEILTPRAAPPLADTAAESVKSARQDLARRLGMAVENITVAGVIGQEFSTDAFLCRTAKERTAREDPPAVISGFSILLKAAGRRYEYHASGKTVLFCRPIS